MTEVNTPTYIIELKNDLVKHIDTSLSDFMATIYKTVALKEDVELIREEIRGIRNEMGQMQDDIKVMQDEMQGMHVEMGGLATKEDLKKLVTKDDFDKVNNLIGKYAVKNSSIEDILLTDHKPRIMSLEKEVFVA
jgi:uncharacterized coiled-coil DUF342 family protein